MLFVLTGRCLFSFFSLCFYFFFNDTATTEIYTLSLHDALPISPGPGATASRSTWRSPMTWRDRKSTRLNSSHTVISYAVFCLKKKKKKKCNYHKKKKKTKKTKQTNTQKNK